MFLFFFKAEFIASTLELVGTLCIAFAALRVHHRVLNEHKVDKKVFVTMRREQIIGVLGVIFVVIGYLMNVILVYFV